MYCKWANQMAASYARSQPHKILVVKVPNALRDQNRGSERARAKVMWVSPVPTEHKTVEVQIAAKQKSTRGYCSTSR